MSVTLIDSNVLLDIFTEDPSWFAWSAEALEARAEESVLVINPIIYAEVSVRFARIEELEEALPAAMFRRDPLPWEAGFLAGKCFLDYRQRGRREAFASAGLLHRCTRRCDRYSTAHPGRSPVPDLLSEARDLRTVSSVLWQYDERHPVRGRR